MKKRILSGLIVATSILCAVPVHAEKKYFDFTVSSGASGHTASASKADSEQYSYITMTGMTTGTYMLLFVDRGSIYGPHSAAVFVDPSMKNQVNKEKYNQTVRPGAGYYLYYENHSSRSTWIAGRYNP